MAITTGRMQACLALVGAGLLKADEGHIDKTRVPELITLMDAFLPNTAAASAESVRLGIDSINSESADEILLDAIKLIRLELNENDRASFLERLLEFALRDDELSFRETQFLNEVADYWDIHAPATGDGKMKLWSILSSADDNDDFKPIHHLALVYVALAHQSDKILSDVELDAIRKKISEWLPNALPADVHEVVEHALKIYARGPEDEVTARAIDVVQKSVPMHQRSALLADLIFVAMADNVILVEERAIIERLARAWGIEEKDPPVADV